MSNEKYRVISGDQWLDERKGEQQQSDAEDTDRVANPLNLRRVLRRDARTRGLVGFDEFANRVVLLRPIPRPNFPTGETFEPRPWSDADDTALTEFFNAQGFKRAGRNVVRDTIELEARSNPFHPLRDYLDALRWDGKPRLSRFLLDYCDADETSDKLDLLDYADDDAADTGDYIEAVTRAFFISAVARVFERGCKADCMLILEGEQGVLKSRLLRLLAVRDDWFSDSLPHDLASKDARAHLAGRWIVEMSEVAQFRRSEIESVKSFLSCQFDKYRPPYGRSDISVPRQSVFVGTTNADTYLHDTSGNRRFWPVRVGVIRLGEVAEIVPQLWAEAVAAYRAGEKWWLSAQLERIAETETKARLELDPWHDAVAQHVEKRKEVTSAEILDHLEIERGRRERVHEMRVGNVLKELRWTRRRRRMGGGQRQYFFTPPGPTR